MRKGVIGVAVLLLLCALPVRVGGSFREDAESPSARRVRSGGWTWFERDGFGVQLDSMNGEGAGPQPIAGKALGSGSHAVLWRDGAGALCKQIENLGARMAEEASYNATTRSGDDPLRGSQKRCSFPSGAHGLLTEFELPAGGYSLLVTAPGGASDTLDRQRNEILEGMILQPAMTRNALAPLLFGGEYACVLKGWERKGHLFLRRSPGGNLQLRLFALRDDSATSIEEVTREVETRIKRNGHLLVDGEGIRLQGFEGVSREYFAGDCVERVLYGQVGSSLLVAVFLGGTADREELAQECSRLAGSIRRIDLPFQPEAKPAEPFNRTTSLRVVAWVEGRTVYWGVLFDEADGSPVLWRENANWTATLKGEGVKLSAAGKAESSRDLNPLTDGETRTLELPEDFSGEATLKVAIRNLSASVAIFVP